MRQMAILMWNKWFPFVHSSSTTTTETATSSYNAIALHVDTILFSFFLLLISKTMIKGLAYNKLTFLSRRTEHMSITYMLSSMLGINQWILRISMVFIRNPFASNTQKVQNTFPLTLHMHGKKSEKEEAIFISNVIYRSIYYGACALFCTACFIVCFHV